MSEDEWNAKGRETTEKWIERMDGWEKRERVDRKRKIDMGYYLLRFFRLSGQSRAQ